jgi:hypothetical protein
MRSMKAEADALPEEPSSKEPAADAR